MPTNDIFALRDLPIPDGRIVGYDPCVYFVQAEEGGPVKIGRSSLDRVTARVAQLQIGNPARLVIRRVVLGTEALEESLHERLREHRIRGEWFSPVADVLALLVRDDAAEPARRPTSEGRGEVMAWFRRRQEARLATADAT